MNDGPRKDDWRSDGYRFHSNGSKKLGAIGEVEIKKVYFKLMVSLTGSRLERFSSKFSREVYYRSNRPNEVLVQYSGDKSAVVALPHGNYTRNEKESKVYHRTKPSVLEQIRDQKDSRPMHINSDLVNNGPAELIRHIVGVPRDMNQVYCTVKRARDKERFSKDQIHSLQCLHYETGFVYDIHTAPDLLVTCYLEGK